jgi:hypothetical protein
MFLKKKKAGAKSSSLMADLEDADALTRTAVYETEDAQDILEDRLTSLQLKRNRQEKENIFSANSKLHKEATAGALYGLGSHKLDYSAMLEENRKALEDKNPGLKQPDLASPTQPAMQEEDLRKQSSNPPQLANLAFRIDPNPADSSASALKPTYQRVQIQNELDDGFNNFKHKPLQTSHTPRADADEEEFVTQDQQRASMEEEFRLRKLEKALEEHQESSKSSLW